MHIYLYGASVLDLSNMNHRSGNDNLTDSERDSRVLRINQWYIRKNLIEQAALWHVGVIQSRRAGRWEHTNTRQNPCMVWLVGTWICSSEPAVLQHSPVRFRRSAQTLEIVEKSIKSSCDVWDQSRRLFSYFRTNESLRTTIRSVGPQLYLRNQSIYHLPVFRQWSNEGLYQLCFLIQKQA